MTYKMYGRLEQIMHTKHLCKEYNINVDTKKIKYMVDCYGVEKLERLLKRMAECNLGSKEIELSDIQAYEVLRELKGVS